ncbi:hypothetical protein Leryth_009751 [Lithospermum erythrorhizon]|nr:hypothetical protein Leryth_009751 [Lithospermum erythrorhizon]
MIRNKYLCSLLDFLLTSNSLTSSYNQLTQTNLNYQGLRWVTTTTTTGTTILHHTTIITTLLHHTSTSRLHTSTTTMEEEEAIRLLCFAAHVC